MNPKKTKDNFESVVREEKENKMNYKKEEGVAKRTGGGYQETYEKEMNWIPELGQV